MKKPTKEELECAAVAAETGEWSEEHTCADHYIDLNGDPSPGQCLTSLASRTYDAINCNDNGIRWLSKNLPSPYNGIEEQETGPTPRYMKFIDDGKGKEVAAAIRSLI